MTISAGTVIMTRTQAAKKRPRAELSCGGNRKGKYSDERKTDFFQTAGRVDRRGRSVGDYSGVRA